MEKSKRPAPKTAPRRKAVAKPGERKAGPRTPSSQESKRLIEELESHKIKLEMQNEELRQIQDELGESNRALRESEEEFRTMFELSAMGMAEVDIKTKRFVRANRKFCELTGYTAAELSKLTIAEITHPDDRGPDSETIQRAMRGETAGWVSEKRYLCKNRDHIWVKVTGAVIFDDKQHPSRLIGAVEDITRYRQAEAALRESENRYRLLFERAGDAILILEAEGEQAGGIVAANRKAALMHGYDDGELVGRSITELDVPAAAREVPGLIKRILAGEWIKKELYHRRKDGSVFPCEISAGLLEFSDHKYILAFDRDITERRQAETMNAALMEDMQRELAARKKLEVALKLSNAELETVNKELEAFAETVSNDLRAPLRSIEGFIQALMEDRGDRLDEVGRDYCRRVYSASHRMTQLIEAMQSMAQLTSGELRERVVNLSAAAQVSAYELKKKEPGRQVEFIIAEGVKAKGDTDMLKLVIENLFENAWKFTGRHPAAKIEFGVADLDGQRAYYVRDDGAGFPMEYAARLFQPFRRLHASAEFPGIGIGLAIAHNIIRRHGGRMWAEAGVEKGATFFFTL
jgi:PAS domain S-box-containing protein